MAWLVGINLLCRSKRYRDRQISKCKPPKKDAIRHLTNSRVKQQKIRENERHEKRQALFNASRPGVADDVVIIKSSVSYQALIDKVIKIAHGSPSKEALLTSTLAKHQLKVNASLTNKLHNIESFKRTNRKAEFAKLTAELMLKHRSLAKISKTSGVKYHKIKRLFAWPIDSPTMRKQKARNSRNDVSRFMNDATISTEVADYKYAHTRFLKQSLCETYPQYLAFAREADIKPVAFSTFCKMRPKNVKPFGKTPARVCICEKCENALLISRSIQGNKIQGVPHTLQDTMKLTFCPYDTQYPKLCCVQRQCGKCGVKLLKKQLISANRSISPSKVLTWHCWEKVARIGKKSKKYEIIEFQGNFATLVRHYCELLDPLGEHLFNAKWQHHQFRLFRSQLPSGTVLQVLDFGQNYLNKFQDEIQSTHWTHNQTTIHPIVSYYKCPNSNTCQQTVTHEQVYISPDLKHDHYGVDQFFKKSCQELKALGVTYDSFVQFTDNCKNQYKSRGPFQTISKSTIPVTRCYFGSRHGKSDADGATGRTKQAVVRARQARQAIISHARDFYDFCKAKLEKKPQLIGCSHFVQTFHYVPVITRSVPIPPTGIPGTASFQMVRTTGIAGVIEARNLVCTCYVCFGGAGLCPNSDYTDPWKTYILPGYSKRKTKNTHFPVASTAKPRGPALVPIVTPIVLLTRCDMGNTRVGASPQGNDATLGTDVLRGTDSSTASGPARGDGIDICAIYENCQLFHRYSELAQFVNGLEELPEILVQNVTWSKDHFVDFVALECYPKDAPKFWLPIDTDGDGNCLFRAISTNISGSEDYHQELRVRCVLELVKHKAWYQSNDYLSMGASVTYGSMGLPGIFAQYSEAFVPQEFPVLTPEIIDLYFKREVMLARTSGCESGLWQVLAMTNVLRRPIRMVFPMHGAGDARADFNRLMMPFHADQRAADPILIMWTPTTEGGHVHHFVPLMRMD